MLNERLSQIRDDITAATLAAERPAGCVTLVAVSKQQPDERIEAALAAGLRVFGENRVQEAKSRWHQRRQHWPDLELRLIGPLQTNKAEEAVGLFDVIETLDREKLAVALAKAMTKLGRQLPCLIQVNTGMEAQKAGIAPTEAVDFARHCRQQHGLNIAGMMCIPPLDEQPAMHFALLAKLASKAGLEVLSMGMSGDYAEAIRFGASHVRIGSALFGERPHPAV